MRTEEKRKGIPPVLRGTLVSLGVYFGGTALLAWLMVSGVMEDGGVALTVLALAAALLGGLSAPGRCAAGGRNSIPNALLSCALFAAALTAAGLACWRTVTWSGEGGVLLACILAGGLGASLFRGGRKKKRKIKF